jgi:hypothetical protein
LRRRVLVGTVTVQALARVVNLYGRRERLAGAVAVQAVTRLVRVQLLMLREVLQRLDAAVVAKAVTQGAIALEFRFQTRTSLGPRVRDGRFFLVTGRAAQGRDGTELAFADGVTVVACDLLFAHVHVVAVDPARLGPAQGNVNAAARVRGLLAISAGAGQDPQPAQHEGEPRPAAALKRRFSRHGAVPGRGRPPADNRRTPLFPAYDRAPSTTPLSARPETAAGRA